MEKNVKRGSFWAGACQSTWGGKRKEKVVTNLWMVASLQKWSSFPPLCVMLQIPIYLHEWPPRGLQHPCFDSLLAIKAACCTYAVTMEGFQLSQQDSIGDRILVVLVLLVHKRLVRPRSTRFVFCGVWETVRNYLRILWSYWCTIFTKDFFCIFGDCCYDDDDEEEEYKEKVCHGVAV